VDWALLDTHILLWWRSRPVKLSRRQRDELLRCERASDTIAISGISLWEIANLAQKGRIEIPTPVDLWLARLEDDPMITILPITARVAAESARLTGSFHKDPADRLIVATALCHGLRLMTADARIRKWGGVPVL
jgi:PIN domain nuclease of toxin-antitoxin system